MACCRRATADAPCSGPSRAVCAGSAPTTSTCCGCTSPISSPRSTRSCAASTIWPRAGKILYAGLSNFPAWMTARAATLAELRGLIPVSGVQLEYSLVERSADRENLPMAEAIGLGAALWSPLGGGVLSGKYRSEYGGPAHRLGSSRAHRRRTGEGGDGRRGARGRGPNRRSGRASRGRVAARAGDVGRRPRWFRSSARGLSNRLSPISRHWTSNWTTITTGASTGQPHRPGPAARPDRRAGDCGAGRRGLRLHPHRAVPRA